MRRSGLTTGFLRTACLAGVSLSLGAAVVAFAAPPAAPGRPPAGAKPPAAAPSAPAAPAATKLEKPVKVITTRLDGSKLNGNVTEYDAGGFTLVSAGDVSQQVKWADLAPARAYDVFDKLLTPSGTAAEWVAAGAIIFKLKDGASSADKAFARALKLDPSVKGSIDLAKDAASAKAGPARAGGGAGPGSEDDTEMLGEVKGATSRDEVLKKLWGPQTDADQAAAVAELKKWAGDVKKVKDESMRLLETKYFLFYSDLKPQEAQNWASLLDKMYARLADLFAVPKGQNLFRGKALVFVFAKEEDYHKFQADSHGTSSLGSLGMCHSYPNGFVHIGFFRQKEELEFASLLVHESVHGFLHRYRSHHRIPSWANEGLAEVIASELVPQPKKAKERKDYAAYFMRTNQMGPSFFDLSHIIAEQYPVAENLTVFMIQQNKRGYVAMINAVKDGMPIDEAMEKKFGASQERIVPFYLESMGIKQKNK